MHWASFMYSAKVHYVLWKQSYSIHPNRHVCTFISGKVRLLILIEAKRQTLPEINVYTRLFGSIEYIIFFSLWHHGGCQRLFPFLWYKCYLTTIAVVVGVLALFVLLKFNVWFIPKHRFCLPKMVHSNSLQGGYISQQC